VYVESGCWDRYRQHSESSCYVAIASGEYHPSRPNPARHAYLNWLKDYLEANEITDQALLKALRKAFFPYEHRFLYDLKTVPALFMRRVVRGVGRRLKRLVSALSELTMRLAQR